MLLLLLALTADPTSRAREVATKLPFAHSAMLELRRDAAAIGDPALRAAVETQLLAPWLPREAWAYSHLAEARKELPELQLPAPNKGDFAAAPGGPCEGGHHGYPGGLAVHTLANLLHARGLAQTYQHVYGVKLRDDYLVAAAIWHDSLKSGTLPFDKDGNCGPEPKLAGTAAHHVLGLASAMLRHLPGELIFIIASAHLPPTPENIKTVCSWVEAAGLIANGEKGKCDTSHRPPVEAFVTHSSDSDYALTGASWNDYVAKTPRGWARYEAMMQDGNDLALFAR